MKSLKLNLVILMCFFSTYKAHAQNSSHLNGMVANKCSGSVVDIGRKENAFAVVLTNGHCVTHKLLPPRVYVKDERYVRSTIEVFNTEGVSIPVPPRNILYGTMEGGDIGLIEIGVTYKELKARGVRIFELSNQDARPGEVLFTASGFWKASLNCVYSQNVSQILEDKYVWSNGMALDSCNTKSGWSGSPLISSSTGKIVGVLNSGNENGERCTINNPCEKDPNGSISVKKGRAYGTPTSVLLNCISNGNINLEKPGCRLFRGMALKNPHDEHLTPKQKLEWLNILAREYPQKAIKIEYANYDMSHMSTSAADKIFVNEAILDSYPLMELVFFACHELGHHFGDKKVVVFGSLAVEAEADYFAGPCLSNFSMKWGAKLSPYINLYRANSYGSCGRDIHCLKMVDIIRESFHSLFNFAVFPDKAIHDKFPNGINTNYPDPNCRALSAVSGLIGATRPACWFNPK